MRWTITALVMLLAGCTTESQTTSNPTASAQLLMSAATDRAAAKLAQSIPSNLPVYLDTAGFEAVNGAYAVADITASLQHRGDIVVTDRKQATVVVDLMSRAVGIDNSETLLGVPQTQVPVTVTADVSVPKMALYDNQRSLGIASFRAVTIDGKTGNLVQDSGPIYGYAHDNQYTVLLLFSWGKRDTVPSPDDDQGINPIPAIP